MDGAQAEAEPGTILLGLGADGTVLPPPPVVGAVGGAAAPAGVVAEEEVTVTASLWPNWQWPVIPQM